MSGIGLGVRDSKVKKDTILILSYPNMNSV